MTSLTSFLKGCYLPNFLRPMLPSVGGFAISSDGYFFISTCISIFPEQNEMVNLFSETQLIRGSVKISEPHLIIFHF